MNNTEFLLRKIDKKDIPFVIDLLQSISKFKPREDDYLKIWEEFSKQHNVHSIVALINKKVVGYGSIVIETKIRGGRMGHVEDIVCGEDYKNKGIGRAIVNHLFDIAKINNCYKVSIQCKEHNILFYEKCDYIKSGVAMQRLI